MSIEQGLLFELPETNAEKLRKDCFSWLDNERKWQENRWGDFEDHPQSVAGYILVVENLLEKAKAAWMKGYDKTALIKLGQISAVALSSMEEFTLPHRYPHAQQVGTEDWRGKNLVSGSHLLQIED